MTCQLFGDKSRNNGMYLLFMWKKIEQLCVSRQPVTTKPNLFHNILGSAVDSPCNKLVIVCFVATAGGMG